ncbi:hypothetical protein [Jatrophihabitans endophyticus]|uniref:hypothetical protein n=1 Tax=Jatrophihabitans endophyticus TaxID=1206085 RepID=UPI0019E4F053|nr:hypothetical protein [Jatrophihabitans endophyticus]MBE7187506.1 hypothetical protein [Jatrophihabitans endophyticus]
MGDIGAQRQRFEVLPGSAWDVEDLIGARPADRPTADEATADRRGDGQRVRPDAR